MPDLSITLTQLQAEAIVFTATLGINHITETDAQGQLTPWSEKILTDNAAAIGILLDAIGTPSGTFDPVQHYLDNQAAQANAAIDPPPAQT